MTMPKKLLCGILVAVLALTQVFAGSVCASGVDPAATNFTGYTQISTKQQLSDIRNKPDGKYVLTQDIEFTDEDFAPGGAFYNDGKGWEPIDTTEGFIFDGNGHIIKGFSIHVSLSDELNSPKRGLFGSVFGSQIQNLGMADANITVKSTGSDSLAVAVIGILVGNTYYSTFSNCHLTGAIMVTVSGDSTFYVGGLIGSSDFSTISDCYNTGTVTAMISSSTNCHFGIIAGNGDASTIDSCHNTGDITVTADGDLNCNIGVIAASASNSIITDCYNTGDITITANSDSYSTIGGIAAFAINNEEFSALTGIELPHGSVVNCYNTGTITAYGRLGFASGIVTDGNFNITNCYNTGTITASNRACGIGGTTLSGCYNSGSISAEDAAGITTNGDSITDCYNTGSIAGVYEAGGIAIGFGFGDVRTTSVTNCYNAGNVAVSGASGDGQIYASGIAGAYNIINCYNTGAVTATCYGYGAHAAGVGDPGGSFGFVVTGCGNTGAITSTASHAAICSGIGGSEITDCYNAGALTATGVFCSVGGIEADRGSNGILITNCYNAGHISAELDNPGVWLAGIAGCWKGAVTNCYYADSIDRGIGEYFVNQTVDCVSCTDEAMQKQETFAGFDFDTVWTMAGDPDYPYPELSAHAKLVENAAAKEKALAELIAANTTVPGKAQQEEAVAENIQQEEAATQDSTADITPSKDTSPVVPDGRILIIVLAIAAILIVGLTVGILLGIRKKKRSSKG